MSEESRPQQQQSSPTPAAPPREPDDLVRQVDEILLALRRAYGAPTRRKAILEPRLGQPSRMRAFRAPEPSYENLY